MYEFKPMRTAGGVCVERHTWPTGIVETQFIKVSDGVWKRARFMTLDKVSVFDEPDIRTYDDAVMALRREFEVAMYYADCGRKSNR